MRHYVCAQLLTCRYEELRELFVSFSILFCGGECKIPINSAATNESAEADLGRNVRYHEYTKRDYRNAYTSFLPGKSAFFGSNFILT